LQHVHSLLAHGVLALVVVHLAGVALASAPSEWLAPWSSASSGPPGCDVI
jgi:hypothetical protein